jgi:HAD superfamily hydrolase (TIGR01509 family)
MRALIFDCDGVLVDTERDGHRVAFNRAFRQAGLDVAWDEHTYGTLLRIAGGKERMRYFFEESGWPRDHDDHDKLVRELHERKTRLFMEIIENGELPLRPGVARLVDEAIESGIRLGICSTSNVRAVTMVVEKMLGEERRTHFEFILAGDVVSAKKPDPEIYDLARERLRLPPEQCVVIEDSRNGLLAAIGAGMRCVITRSYYTSGEEFGEADLVVDSLGEPGGPHVTVADLSALVTSIQ